MEHRLVLDTVNEVSRALLELVPWRAREGLDKLVSDTNERYKLVSDTIKQRVEEIDAAIQRSQQVSEKPLQGLFGRAGMSGWAHSAVAAGGMASTARQEEQIPSRTPRNGPQQGWWLSHPGVWFWDGITLEQLLCELLPAGVMWMV